ncbi:hypothetical protein [Roseibium aggregatum]|uniref:DUF5681 domain-containing protein n=1 Tax=Roseibium aggregatum TaxID=187304 RepID=A0A0M6Y6K7_9HYPH|nr:hypothetical protein [Roseibium aggregatum]CTQ45735.1 hypothetical protein LAL4801_04190 [Roseibium aggregatum]
MVGKAINPSTGKRVRTGGREKGTPNKTAKELRDAIAKAGLVNFYSQIMNGEPLKVSRLDVLAGSQTPVPLGFKTKQEAKENAVWILPTIDQRIKAADTLIKRVLPELKAVEMEIEGQLDNPSAGGPSLTLVLAQQEAKEESEDDEDD